MMTLESTIRQVVKTLQSCKTKQQLESSIKWGVEVISKASTEQKPISTNEEKVMKKKLIPPAIRICKVCQGTGGRYGEVCTQCKGSGRVITTNELTTYITPYCVDLL